MTEDAINLLSRRLERNSTWVAAGLAFMVVFSVSVSILLFWNTYQLGSEAARSKALDKNLEFVLCSLKHETATRLRIFAVDSVGVMPEPIRRPLEESYRATLATFAALDCEVRP